MHGGGEDNVISACRKAALRVPVIVRTDSRIAMVCVSMGARERLSPRLCLKRGLADSFEVWLLKELGIHKIIIL